MGPAKLRSGRTSRTEGLSKTVLPSQLGVLLLLLLLSLLLSATQRGNMRSSTTTKSTLLLVATFIILTQILRISYGSADEALTKRSLRFPAQL